MSAGVADRETDCVVVGGGVAGLAAALYLSRGGARVTVVESNRVGSGASSGNAGWLCPAQAGPLPQPGLTAYGLRALVDRGSALYFAPRHLPRLLPWLLRFRASCTADAYTRGGQALGRLGTQVFELVYELIGDGLAVPVHRRGLLAVGERRDSADRFLQDLRPLRLAGVPTPDRVLDRNEIHALEPGLSKHPTAAVHVQDHWHVEPDRFAVALAALVREANVEILEGAEVRDFDVVNGQVRRVRTAAGVVAAENVVLAAGAWTPPLARMLGLRLPVAAGKGYSFVVEPEVVPEHALLLLEPHVGCSPLGDGRVRIAGTMEFSGINSRLDRRRLNTIAEGAQRLLSPWRGCDLSNAWVGMRPIAPDGLPVIDRLSGSSNVFLATAYSMLGMTLALPAGRALAELVLRDHRPPELEPFALSRFGRARWAGAPPVAR